MFGISHICDVQLGKHKSWLEHAALISEVSADDDTIDDKARE